MYLVGSSGLTNPNCGRRLPRRGLSFVEFLGCLIALAGGVLLGSYYLGIDVRTMMVGVLEKADLVDVEESPSDTEEGATTAGSDKSASDTDEQGDSNITPGATATRETPTESSSDSSEPIVADEPERFSFPWNLGRWNETDDEALQFTTKQEAVLTHKFWTTLDACMKQEKQNRMAFITETDSWQLFDYLAYRRDGHRKAAQIIAELDRSGVDERVLAHADRARDWHLAGVKLFHRAVELLTAVSTPTLSGPIAQSWQSSATQHRMEEKLLKERHHSVAEFLKHSLKAEDSSTESDSTESAETGQPAAN